MSSPATGDISNSDHDPTDLPVYSRSYMVYGQNIWRAEREAVHNHGHQLEAILTHADIRQDGIEDLFWPNPSDNSAVAAGRKNRRTRR